MVQCYVLWIRGRLSALERWLSVYTVARQVPLYVVCYAVCVLKGPVGVSCGEPMANVLYLLERVPV